MSAQAGAGERDRFPNRKRRAILEPRKCRATEMFQVNVAIGVEDRARHRIEIARHARAFEVSDAHPAVVDNAISRLRDANAQIEIVAIHEDALVEYRSIGSNALERAARREHES